MSDLPKKILGGKAYGSIPHLPESRMGPGDHKISDGQARIVTVIPRDKWDRIICTEKIDGSNTSVAKINNCIYALGRSGYLAQTSSYEQHQIFAEWVRRHDGFFKDILADGERIVGEWCAQAHGTKYKFKPDDCPWFPFDLINKDKRLPYNELKKRIVDEDIKLPYLIYDGPPITVEKALSILGKYGKTCEALDEIEGIVYKVERKGIYDFMTKYVKPYKEDGKYFPNAFGQDTIWNWHFNWSRVNNDNS